MITYAVDVKASADNMSTVSPSTDDAPRRRMPAGQRQQQVLEAGVAAFAEGGYAGTTTDQVARRAGVSQPYVVRMFGGKQPLFLAVHAHVLGRVEAAFRAAAAGLEPGDDPMAALGQAYVELIADHDLLRVMQHGFVAAGDPALGPVMRAGLVGIYRLIRELTGAGPEEARDFLAHGMLINTLMVVQLPEHAGEDPAAAELLECVLDK